MAQTTSGLRAALSHARVHQAVQNLLGGPRSRGRFFDEHVQAKPGERLLDVGCGTGIALDHLPEGIDYVGVDLSEAYIADAQRRYGAQGRGRFASCDVSEVQEQCGGPYDVVLAKGLLHHLDDAQVRTLLRDVAPLLAPGGRVVTFDGAYTPDQSRLARWIISRDRGQDVRPVEGYADLARQFFADVQVHVRHDLLRVPYTHCILDCRSPHPHPPASGSAEESVGR